MNFGIESDYEEVNLILDDTFVNNGDVSDIWEEYLEHREFQERMIGRNRESEARKRQGYDGGFLL